MSEGTKLRLTREQRAALFAGNCPSIKGAGKTPVEKGCVLRLSAKLSLEVTEVRRPKAGGWSLGYIVHDERDPIRLLRRVPPAHMEEWERFQHRPPTEAEIREAADESAYTSSGRKQTSIADAGEAVSPEWQARFTKEAHEATDVSLKEQLRALGTRYQHLKKQADEYGVDVTRQARAIHRQIQTMERKIASARKAA